MTLTGNIPRPTISLGSPSTVGAVAEVGAMVPVGTEEGLIVRPTSRSEIQTLLDGVTGATAGATVQNHSSLCTFVASCTGDTGATGNVTIMAALAGDTTFTPLATLAPEVGDPDVVTPAANAFGQFYATVTGVTGGSAAITCKFSGVN